MPGPNVYNSDYTFKSPNGTDGTPTNIKLEEGHDDDDEDDDGFEATAKLEVKHDDDDDDNNDWDDDRQQEEDDNDNDDDDEEEEEEENYQPPEKLKPPLKRKKLKVPKERKRKVARLNTAGRPNGKVKGQDLHHLLASGASLVENIYFEKDVRRATRVYEHVVNALEGSKYRALFGIATGMGIGSNPN